MTRIMRALAVFLALGLCWLFPSCAFAQDVEEAVVVDDDGVVAEEAVADESANGWSALPVEARQVGDKLAFARQSSDAFADPDQRQALEPKYYFVLEPKPAEPVGPFRNGPTPTNVAASVSDSVGTMSAIAGALASAIAGQDTSVTAAWLDRASETPTSLAVLSKVPRDSMTQLSIAKCAWPKPGQEIAGEAKAGGITIQGIPARRSVPENETALALDAWDIPPAWKSKSTFLSRIVAVLKLVDGRYCVDFHSPSLNEEADCRVWLTPADHEFGAARGIEFIELPIVKGDQPQPVWVCAVDYGGRRIAFDFPLCRPAIMEQMQKLMASQKPKPGQTAKGPDLSKIVGEDLLDEFARRLVNGTYK